VHSWLNADSYQQTAVLSIQIKIQKSATESFARTGEAIVNLFLFP